VKSSLVLTLNVALLVSSSAFGQTPQNPKDSAAHDSAAVDSIRIDSTRQVKDAYGLEAAFIALAAAPAGLAAIIPKDSTQHPGVLGFWSDHASFYFTEGLASGRDGPILGASWTGSGSLEALRRGILLEVRVEQFKLLKHVEYHTIHVGRMFHTDGRMVGGVTLGYRSVRNLRAHEGVEVGFPFVRGGQNAWMRLESAYVMSAQQSSWNYRLQGERRVNGGPFIAGFTIELNSWELRDHGELSHGHFSLLLGTTYWGR